MRTRIALGACGALIVGYGLWRLLGTARLTRPRDVGEWLVGALILHDAVLAPATMAVGFVLSRTVRPRARRYLTGTLVASALVTVVAVPLIHRRGKAPAGTTLETQNYVGHLAVLVALVAAAAGAAYALRVLRDRQRAMKLTQRRSDANVLPLSDQDSNSR